jgi:hypothetical protein
MIEFTTLCNVGLPLLIQFISVVVFITSMKTNQSWLIKAISDFKEQVKEDINRLEKKQDKHNGLIERMVVVEQSCKSAHHRLDHMEN